MYLYKIIKVNTVQFGNLMSDLFAKFYITHGLKINLEKLLANFRLSLSDSGNTVKRYLCANLI